MKRIGAKNTPVFRIVVADSRSPRDGKFIEEIGTYQPLQEGRQLHVRTSNAPSTGSAKARSRATPCASFIKKASKARRRAERPEFSAPCKRFWNTS